MTRPHNSAETRNRLLDAARDVIRAQGYPATTIDDVCASAGVTKGVFFHHFESEERLGVAAAERLDAPDASWSAESLDSFMQSALQEALIFAKAKQSPDGTVESLRRLLRALETILGGPAIDVAKEEAR